MKVANLLPSERKEEHIDTIDSGIWNYLEAISRNLPMIGCRNMRIFPGDIIVQTHPCFWPGSHRWSLRSCRNRDLRNCFLSLCPLRGKSETILLTITSASGRMSRACSSGTTLQKAWSFWRTGDLEYCGRCDRSDRIFRITLKPCTSHSPRLF